MTTLSQTAGQDLSRRSAGGFARFLADGIHALFDYLGRRAAVRTLHELDDRALRDIGISRCQIERAVSGAFQDELTRYL